MGKDKRCQHCDKRLRGIKGPLCKPCAKEQARKDAKAEAESAKKRQRGMADKKRRANKSDKSGKKDKGSRNAAKSKPDPFPNDDLLATEPGLRFLAAIAADPTVTPAVAARPADDLDGSRAVDAAADVDVRDLENDDDDASETQAVVTFLHAEPVVEGDSEPPTDESFDSGSRPIAEELFVEEPVADEASEEQPTTDEEVVAPASVSDAVEETRRAHDTHEASPEPTGVAEHDEDDVTSHAAPSVAAVEETELALEELIVVEKLIVVEEPVADEASEEQPTTDEEVVAPASVSDAVEETDRAHDAHEASPEPTGVGEYDEDDDYEFDDDDDDDFDDENLPPRRITVVALAALAIVLLAFTLFVAIVIVPAVLEWVSGSSSDGVLPFTVGGDLARST